MNYLISLLLTLSFCASSVNAQKIDTDEWNEYIRQNQQEKRLIEHRDNDSVLRLKLLQLKTINASREKHKAKPVKLDIFASRVANKMAIDAAQNKFMGHFNQNGEKPYHRYAFAGGVDHVSENAAAIRSSLPISTEPAVLLKHMKDLHLEFMNEKAPNDGHKQTIIHPTHNHVGIGIGVSGNEFRYYEEYIERYLTFGNFARETKHGSTLIIPVKPNSPKHHLYWVSLQYEPFPKKMSVDKINRQNAYDDFTSHTVVELAPWEIPQPQANGYTELTFTLQKKGIYYLHIYLSDQPYRSGSASTKGKIQASGVVIEVR